ncbi:MAG: ABC transporter permease [Acidobacteriota bacterium]
MTKLHPLKELFLCRLRIFFREPATIFWVYGFPLLLALGLGIAFRDQPPERIRVDIRRDDPSAAEHVRRLLAAREGFVVALHGVEECATRLRLGKSDITILPGDPFEYIFDPTRPSSLLARTRVDAALQKANGRIDPVRTRDRPVTERGSRYIDFLIPGLLGMNLMGGGLWGVGFVTVDMRVRKLLKRLVATPMRRGHFLAALMGSRLIFMLPELVLLMLFGVLFFDVVIVGSYLGVLLVSTLGAVSFAGLGLLVASRAQKIETISGLVNLVMLPMWLLSGIFFSSERFPDVAQPFIQALPLTMLNDALRAVILEGASLSSQLSELAGLVTWGVGSFIIALKWFRWS